MDIDAMNKEDATNREEFGLSEEYKMPKTICADNLIVDKIFTDGIYLDTKNLDTFEWACDEVYQNSDEKLDFVIGSIPIMIDSILI